MDRNVNGGGLLSCFGRSLSARRAWIEISKIWYCGTSIGLSLSARRAWIEISGSAWVQEFPELSLSARRAWIEIRYTSHDFHAPKVALRKESVDRNDLSRLRDGD